MALLTKLKASTLMETLVATLLIFVVFMLASAILNNLFSNSIKNNTSAIESRLTTLHYLWQNDKLQIPYSEDLNNWQIVIEPFKEYNLPKVEFTAVQKETQKTISIVVLDE